MKIIVNTRLLLSNRLNGIGWFAYHTLKRIVKQHPNHEFVFLFDRNYDEHFIFNSNVIPEVVFPPTRHPVLSYIWLEHAIINSFKKHKPDVFFSPDGFLSLKVLDIPSLPVLHDINFEHYPKDLPVADRLFYKYFFPKYAQHAKRILTVSEYSKHDIVSRYNIHPDIIDVAYNASDEIYAPVSPHIKTAVKARLTGNCDYFLYVGVLVPRKNIVRMLLAFEEFKKVSGSNIKLVIVGKKLFMTSEIEKTYSNSNYKNDIIFTGHITTGELRDILGSAISLLYVSYFEGFGIPIVEAMNADVPVITSNITSMPEIAGEAALLVDPFSVDSIAKGMLKIFWDEKLRSMLIEKGRKRRQDFSWDNTAARIWWSIEKCIT
jgi:glycosyltransferase involved in cell wall biosynthesis